MALNATEIVVIANLLRLLSVKEKPRVLSLGYPDCFFSPTVFERFIPWVDISRIKFRAVSEAFLRANNKEGPVLDPHSIFNALGAELYVSDLSSAQGGIELDLNDSIPRSFTESFDLIIDPGTIEHCFHAGIAVMNVANMLKVGGVAYHQCCISFPGHGFYSISPTFFVDFYALNGFDLSFPLCWGEAVRILASVGTDESLNKIGFVSPIYRMDFRREFSYLPSNGPLYGMYIAKKVGSLDQTKTPIQARYGNLSIKGFQFKPIIDDQAPPINARLNLSEIAQSALVVLE